MKNTPKEALPTREINVTLEALDDPSTSMDVILFIGSLALSCLKEDGIVTLFVRDYSNKLDLPDDERKRFIHIAPVTQVFLLPDALADNTGKKVKRFVRPIVTTGRPVYVARKDGELWEVEFEEENSTEGAANE